MKMQDAPRLDRPLNLQMKGDWGLANLHRACGWMSDFVVKHTAAGTRVAIWNGLGGKDNVESVAKGEVDLALATPASFVAAAMTGDYPFEGTPYPQLRALAVLPQRDAMVLGVASCLGVRTIEDLHALRPALTIAAPPDDGITFMGMGAHRHLEALGLGRTTVESWGGRFLDIEDPGQCLAAVSRGDAQAVMHEAIMGPWWRDAVEKVGLRIVATPDDVLDGLQQRFGWRSRTLSAGYFETVDTSVNTLDFSDFLVVVSDQMPDDVAYLLTWGLVNTRARIEQQYRHIKPEWSPLTYPLEPSEMGRTPIPLHAGARRFYEAERLL
ncbi:TAXI family TRAP transporter solute-binding subunit [Burkholderia gladioli pv. gladioli]|uniref:Uncharacterized protein n=1 Tax=Burkholderia gladioli TaxID=28095 RepID=A0A095F0N9_BURGA|nr:TAXI family TRAP transporter solute-binding subunit [Burkholderia gladioli]AJW99350.1 hypothetical protein BM43_4143 [Burkholderia gladioli]ASD79972.1 hypothetical protein CEJ98_13935 [Burkholderia gladioli pv. gladioli]AWY54782.1 hypothetical protein A8H28_27195 [Burkholderia gladioli pv. gladioli]KGC11231.1 hypothetical protein DM48_7352 [Burkholderia gladioli]MDJ1164230.1 TAXI family TRAP transporter solute-binding subunit [Burkholderia gladioli pv. gladioli]